MLQIIFLLEEIQVMIQNKVEKHFDYANEKAGELCFKAKKFQKKCLIGGSLPPQNITYVFEFYD